MRFVPVKGTEQQSVLMLHRTRSLLVRQRTMLANALRSHLSEFGIVVAKGIENIAKLAAIVEGEGKGRLPAAAVTALTVIIKHLRDLKARIDSLEKEIVRWHRRNPESRRLATIPGIGPITASALSATITDASQFKSGRQLAAWLGLVPRQNSSGGKERLGRISKQRDRYLRQLLVIGATSMLGGGQQEPHSERCLGDISARQEATTPGDRCPGQQDGPYRLGRHGPTGVIQGQAGSGLETERQG